ncbi:hypothetical protein GSY69_04210 [Brevibacterium sp. 5221]|uniref:Lipoprotein n=1 Tax=Brevibacterium rongguiense TaxID=2695267 RepID=A0A6N9H6I2_9MICO|nr:hypothetical protein [Brevibacterium rongguiense]MYM19194.1 hypothetical protein [Brevibacterium rongguiense]
MGRRALVPALGGALAGALLLAGCSTARPGVEVDADALVTDQTVAALFISPQAPYLDDDSARPRSFVAAIDRDGSLRAYRSAPMQGGTPVWSDGQVLVADREFDHRFFGGGSAHVEHRKPDAQVAAYPLRGRGAFGAVYNDGQADDAYRVVVSSTQRGRFSDTAVDGSYLGIGVCASGLIGVAVDDEADGEADSEPRMAETISRIDPLTHRLSVLGHARVAPEALPLYTQRPAPCRDGVVSAIVDSERPEEKTARLRRIDAASGRSTVRTLTDERGAARRFDFGDYGIDPVFSALSLSRGALDWVSSDGVVWRTELATAKTRRLFDTGADWVAEQSAVVDFSRDCVAVLDIADDDAGRLRIFDRSDGALVHSAAVPDLRDVLGERARIEGFAADPAL